MSTGVSCDLHEKWPWKLGLMMCAATSNMSDFARAGQELATEAAWCVQLASPIATLTRPQGYHLDEARLDSPTALAHQLVYSMCTGEAS